MSWKKNGFSYLLWFIYTIAVSVGVLGFFGISTGLLDAWDEYCLLAIAGAYVVVGLLVFGLHRLTAKRSCFREGTSIVPVIVEGVLVLALFVAGIVLRVSIMPHLTGEGADMVYFEAAKVAEGSALPQVVHGASYIYLELLHSVFLLFGNRLIAAVWLQVALYMLACIFLYFAVRELTSRLPAIVMLIFLMISPFSLLRTMELSPEILYFLIYSIALWAIADNLKKNDCNSFVYIVVGVLIGVCCYLDITGVSLLVFAAGVFTVEREQPVNKWNKRGYVFGCNILGTLIGWFAIIILDAMLCGKDVLAVLSAWLQLYQPGAFTVWFEYLRASEDFIPNGVVLYAFLVFGVFSFWCRRKQERQGIWIGATLVLILLHCFQMVTAEVPGNTYLYAFFAVLAGISVADIFAVTPVSVIAEEQQETESVVAQNMEDASEVPEEEKTEEALEIIDIEREKPQIKFLDNPLPLPKKHEAKVMDYRITEVTGNDFDYDIADDDDFDI